MAITPADQLRAAKALIDAPEKWTRGAFARNAAGDSARYDEATCFCTVGAIDRAGHLASAHDDTAETIVRGELPESFSGGITDFNDHPATTHADIMALFDRAIALADREAGDA